MPIMFKRSAAKIIAPQPQVPQASSDTLDTEAALTFFKVVMQVDFAISAQNAVKRHLFATYRKKYGPERTDALKLACARKLADPAKLAKNEAVTKEAATYLAMLDPTAGRVR